jgi:hypothetical protein
MAIFLVLGEGLIFFFHFLQCVCFFLLGVHKFALLQIFFYSEVFLRTIL